MANDGTGTLLQHLRRAADPRGGDAADGQLLCRFVARSDPAAFEALVRRHGPMVLGVCRRLLGNHADAEDAFQATFLVLASRAGSVARRGAVGGWLYGVARRIALRARRDRAARRARERQVATMPHPEVMPAGPGEDLTEVLDRELERLPEKYRLPVVLCELEGRPRREVARRLGLPEGTLSSRLAAARKLLAKRLAGYAPGLSAAAVGVLLAERASAAVPKALVVSTVRAASGAIDARVAALAEGVVKAMFLTKLKVSAGAFLLAVAASAGAVGVSYRTAAADAPRQPAAQSIRDELDALRLEVEALRKGQQALRERLREVEAGQARQSRTEATLGEDRAGQARLEKLDAARAAVREVAAREQAAWEAEKEEVARKLKWDQQTKAKQGLDKNWRAAAPAGPAPLDEALSAAKALRLAPDNKAALDALERILRRLKEAERRPDGAGEKAGGGPNQPAKPAKP